MSTARIIVSLAGLIAALLVAWFFWFKRGKGTRAGLASGVQEVLVLVKGGYSPDLIVVEHGKLRLNFRRDETASCSEMVILDGLNRSAALPEGQIVPVEFVPEKPGEYEFHCQMGMLRGKLVVE